MTSSRTYTPSAIYPLLALKPTGVSPGFVTVTNAKGTTQFGAVELAWALREEVGGAAHESRVALAHPCDDSILSGKPAFVFRTEEVALALTLDELVRLHAHALTPKEFFELATRRGVFYEISGEFYNEENGRPWTEMELFKQARTLRSKQPQLLLVEDLNGHMRPHSITSLALAEQFAAQFDDKLSLRTHILDLTRPAGAWRPDPFDNFVAVYKDDKGQLRAYGRFMSSDEAKAFSAPYDSKFSSGKLALVASVNAAPVF